MAAQQYYPFGMLMPASTDSSLRRQYSLDEYDYRYGFNGKEGDDEIKGDDNQQDYGMRIYDPRVGRFLSVDPIAREYPMLTPYQFASNSPISGIDLDGLEIYYAIDGSYIGKYGTSTEIRVITNNEILESGLAKRNLSHSDWKNGWLRESHHSQVAYTNPSQAALDWAYEYNPQTAITEIRYYEMPYVEKGYEFGAMIGSLNTKDENGNPITLYTLGSTKRGDDYLGPNVDVLKSETLPGWERTHGVHTHPGKGNVDSDELFSDRATTLGLGGDKELARDKNFKFYLATPKGMLKMYDPSTDSESLITSGVPGRNAVDVVESGTFKDTHGRTRKKYNLVYKKIKAPILNDTIEKK